jgi:hypothetical protein
LVLLISGALGICPVYMVFRAGAGAFRPGRQVTRQH